jgi:hypothetical protein
VFTDEHGRVIGFPGLAIRPMPHRITVNGRTPYAWCALGHPLSARAARRDRGDRIDLPNDGERINLTVDGAEVTSRRPAEIVLSFLRRAEPFDADTIRTFCHYVHFFANREAAADWTSQHEGTFTLSLADGSAIARLTNRALPEPAHQLIPAPRRRAADTAGRQGPPPRPQQAYCIRSASPLPHRRKHRGPSDETSRARGQQRTRRLHSPRDKSC